MKSALLVAVAVALLVTGCADSRAILYRGITAGVTGKRLVISDAAASRAGKELRSEWLADIASRGREDPAQRFSNLPAATVRRRLDAAAARYGFTVKTLRFLHPREAAPLVTVQTRDYLAFARAVPPIEKSLDPHTGHSDLVGWAFEAVFLEAQDERGVPFVVATNAVRGQPSGGQWARSEELYPFVHG